MPALQWFVVRGLINLFEIVAVFGGAILLYLAFQCRKAWTAWMLGLPGFVLIIAGLIAGLMTHSG